MAPNVDFSYRNPERGAENQKELLINSSPVAWKMSFGADKLEAVQCNSAQLPQPSEQMRRCSNADICCHFLQTLLVPTLDIAFRMLDDSTPLTRSGPQGTKAWCGPLVASTPGLKHPRHQQKHASKSSTLSSAASQLVSSKPLNEFTANDTTSTSSVAKSALTEEEQLFGEFLNVPEMLQASELSSTGDTDPPTFIKLAPYFESIPNRKYTSLSRLRQMRCVNLAGDPITHSRRSIENLYQNGILGQPFSEAQGARAELVFKPGESTPERSCDTVTHRMTLLQVNATF
ncbi:hypothetical protein TSMEX_003486 [Taenia solium]|eukprot:TsM_001133700 transcript=TsM_001133700 gene=TsM_001133700